MPERLDRISVATHYGTVPISWQAREALLNELRAVDNAFQKVGASRAVQLDRAGKRIVLEAIHAMAGKTPKGFAGLEPGLEDLRHKLADELGFE